jgi:DNA-binding HxlR family transcriptional regulator
MKNKSVGPCFCPLESFMGVISKKWALLIINAVGTYGRLRFNRIMEEMHSISPRTLSDRLKELQAEGLIEREFFAEIPPRVEYWLSKDGVELRESIIPLLNWIVRRNVANGRTVDCECEACKSIFGSQAIRRRKMRAHKT